MSEIKLPQTINVAPYWNDIVEEVIEWTQNKRQQESAFALIRQAFNIADKVQRGEQ